jgi:SAM-dependent methyltransferase
MSDPAIRHSGPVVRTVVGVDVIDCAVCGFKHVDPLPDQGALETLYTEDFYQADKIDYLKEAEEDLPWLQRLFADRCDLIEAASGAPGARSVLDIGCGPGFFLDTARGRGWTGLGLEPSPDAVAFARGRGLDVRQGFFTADAVADAAPFDAVHMSEVLEHVLDPRALLEDARAVLKPGGVLCVSVPNDFNPFQTALVEAGTHGPWWIVPDHHLNYFDFASLEGLIARAGFDLRARDTTFPMEMFLLMGHDYTGEPALGRQVHGWRKAFDLTLADHDGNAARRALYGALAAAGLGRLAVVAAVKPDEGGAAHGA